MNTKCITGFVIGLTSLAGLAQAQVTRMVVQTSLDGASWVAGPRSAPAGSTVQVRYLVSFDPAGTTQSPAGFASLTFQPTVSNWTGSDAIVPFASLGNNSNGGAVSESSGGFGRIIPFAATGPTSVDPYRGHVQSAGGVNYLRLARTTITNWIGVGPTTGTAAANNFNGAGGLALVQKAFGSIGTGDPAFNSSTSNVVLFRFAFTLSADQTPRQLQITAPTEAMSRNATTGAREASWYATLTDFLGSVKTGISVEGATVDICQPPVAAIQPLPAAAHPGANATFVFSVTGPAPISYRWRRNGTPLSDDARTFGATSSTLTLTQVASGDVATYDCVATSTCSELTSAAASLSLTPCSPAWLAAGDLPFGVRWVHAQAYSGANAGTLLYGGRGPSNVVQSDTWLRAGSRWTRVATTGPGPRNDHGMASSPGGKVLLFGGQTGAPGVPSTFMSDTWEWDGTTWTQVASTGPAARLAPAMAFDSIRNRVLMFGGMSVSGGFLSDLWEWNGTVWTQITPAGPQPPARFAAAMAFDPVRRRLVMFSGLQSNTYLTDTWEWDGTAWTQVASSGPPGRFYHAMAYDPRQGGVVLFGGRSGTIYSGLDVWNGRAWVAGPTGGSAVPRWAGAGSYDPSSSQLIFTGGAGNGSRDVPFADAIALAHTIVIAAQPAVSASACEGSTATGLLSFGVSSPSAVLFQWKKAGVPIPGATSSQLTISPVNAASAGSYTCEATSSCNTVESDPASVVVLTAPLFTQQPGSVTSCFGAPVTLTAVASGSGPITFQWFKDGTPIDGATQATFSIGTLTTSNAGSYSCKATNACATVESSAATITVQVPPSIITQPASISVCETQPATFSVAVGGTGPFTYVWKRNGVVVPNASAAILSLSPVTLANAGSYVCEVSGPCGSVTTDAATLTVRTPTSITVQPIAIDACAGLARSLSVTATGTGPITYQWRKNGTAISGATSATLSFPSLSSSDAGSYSCVVTGSCNSVTSSAVSVSVRTAPVISQQPSAVDLCAGQAASLSVTATGTTPLTFQWNKNGTAIPGATSATLSFAALAAADAGSYTCTITNLCGNVTTSAATVSVRIPVAITAQPSPVTTCVGSPFSLTVGASGTGPLTYQWRRNGQNISGATSVTLSFASAVVGHAGSYDCVVTGSCNSTTSSTATVTVRTAPEFSQQPASVDLCVGQPTTLAVAATGTTPLTFQWNKNGTAIPGATSATLSFASLAAADAGSYTCTVTNVCASVTSSAATVAVRTPVAITAQPAAVDACAGLPRSLSVTASGTGPISYQWRKGGVAIAGATSATLSFASLAVSDAGSYDCVVASSCNSVTSSSVSVTVRTAPVLSQQPSSVDLCQGQATSLTVAATGTTPLTFQWRKNGAIIPGATSPTLSFASLAAGDAGSYACTVTNSCSSLTSDAATVGVRTPTSITAQPVAIDACAGDSRSLSVTAAGSGPLTFQWRKGGTPIAGATSSTLAFAAIATGDAGSYDCIVTGSCNAATSNAVVVSVRTAPVLSQQPSPVDLCEGQSTSLTVVATGTAPLTFQWSRNGAAIPGATAASLSFASLVAGDAGSYVCTVTNSCSSVTSAAATVTVRTPLSWNSQPQSAAICDGAAFSLVATAVGTGPITYRWTKDGSTVAGATESVLGFASVSVADSGVYVCEATGSCGSITSAAATLTVRSFVAITQQPSSLAVAEGQSASMTVAASGSAPVSFQWRKNGAVILGATASTLAFSPVTASDVGSYSCVVTNPCGSVTSVAASLHLTTSSIVAAPRCGPVQLIDVNGGDGDRFGSVSASADTIIVGADLSRVGVNEDQGHAVVFRRTAVGYAREATLSDPDGVAGDNFGNVTAVVGDTAVVAAWLATVDGRAQQGAAYVYTRVGGSWVLQSRLTASDGAAGDAFGVSLAFDGDTIVVGSYQDDVGAANNRGSVYVFTRSDGTWTQQAKILAADGEAGDTFGNAVHVRGDMLIVGAPRDATPAGSSAGSAYVFRRSGVAWTQEAKLLPSDGRANDYFGMSVGIEGDVAVVGAFYADVASKVNQGAAYAYARVGGVWTQETKLLAPDGEAGDSLGLSLSMRRGPAGVSVAVGAVVDDVGDAHDAGSVHLFDRVGSSWVHQARFETPAGNAGATDWFGFPIALADDTLVVGVSLDDVGARVDCGSAWVFSKVGGAWLLGDSPLVIREGDADGELLAAAMSVSGDTLAVGMPRNAIGSNVDQGAVKLFTRQGGRWTPQATLVASDGAAHDRFGSSVAIEGDVMVVGSPQDESPTPPQGGTQGKGSAYVFVRSAGAWTQQAKVMASDAAFGDGFGESVALSGDTMAIGAARGGATGEGAVYAFARSGAGWSQQARIVPAGGAAGDAFGASLALAGDRLIVGSPGDDGATGIDQGSVYVFGQSAGAWTQQARLVAADAAEGDAFGRSVAIDGSLLVVGSPNDDGGSSIDQGSIYVFADTGSGWMQQARLVASDGASGDGLGSAVDVEGGLVIGGAPFDDAGVATDAGGAVLFSQAGSSWLQQPRLVAPQVTSGARMGTSVTIEGGRVVMGGQGITTQAGASQAMGWALDTPPQCIPGVLNLATDAFSSTLSAAISASQSGHQLLATPAAFNAATLVDTLGRSLSIGSTGSVRMNAGSILTLGAASSLLAAADERVEIDGQLLVPSGATAQVVAERFQLGGKGGLAARMNASLTLDVERAELNGSVRVESGASFVSAASLTELNGPARIDASASFGVAGDLVTSSAITAAADSSFVATGILDLQGSTSLTNSLAAATTILNRDRLDLSGAVTLEGGTVNLRDLNVFGSSAIFGDFTNGLGAVTTIRSGTLFLFGSLSNSGTIVGTLCSNCLGTPPRLEVGGHLTLGASASLLLPFEGSFVSLAGRFDSAIDSNERFDLSLAMLQFEGTGSEQTMEAMSADIGASETGLDRTVAGHFPIRILKIGPAPSTVRLVDDRDNDGAGQENCEAIYVDRLEIGPGSRLINDGCAKIYYRELILEGTVDVLDNLIPFTPPCIADFNADGGVDGGDIEAFFAAWENAEPSTDVNQDGGIDGGDVELYYSRWEAGC